MQIKSLSNAKNANKNNTTNIISQNCAKNIEQKQSCISFLITVNYDKILMQFFDHKFYTWQRAMMRRAYDTPRRVRKQPDAFYTKQPEDREKRKLIGECLFFSAPTSGIMSGAIKRRSRCGVSSFCENFKLLQEKRCFLMKSKIFFFPHFLQIFFSVLQY